MKTTFAPLRQKRLRMLGFIALCATTVSGFAAQTPRPRVLSEINGSESAPIKGSLHPLAQAQNDAGRMPTTTPVQGVTLQFSRSAAQEADLEALLAAQQNPASPLYHQWLTPDQFAARFGMADADLQKVQSWLEQQGFTGVSVNRSHNAIRFSGTVGQIEQAFQTQMHYYQADGVKHFAPSTALSVPAALGPVVKSVQNLSDFRPRAQMVLPRRQFTSSVSGSVFFAPGDIATAYDINPLYSGGINGAGQTIAIMGQSAVQVSDIERFQAAAKLTTKDPTMILVPGSGASMVYNGDESESDLDLEWAGAMAPGANIVFVYTGSNSNQGVYDSARYAVDEDLASIISLSYSSCETDLSQSSLAALEAVFKQAAAQGQTVLAASGDQGSTACYGDTTLTTVQQQAITVNYPASSAYVLGIGGTEISAANNSTSASQYWQAASGSDVLTSVKQYIPEVAWNDDSSSNGLSASGGGASVLIQRPTWQTGVPGIASGSMRLVPDVSLYSSSSNPGYLYCTSDTTSWQPASGTTGAQQASCNNGFRDSATQDVTLAGGTSFATPIFAGMVALLNQKLNYTNGQGVINASLYQLAANSTIYASAFHDVTSGNNNCSAGTAYCGATTGGFSAGAGYDEVTGLGSVDLANLAAAWPANTGPSASLMASTTTVTPPASGTPALNSPLNFTIKVLGADGAPASGTVKLSIDGGNGYLTNGSVQTVTLDQNGQYTYSASFTVTGMHQIVAQYQGDATHATSSGTGSITITPFTVTNASSTLTVTQGKSGTQTVTVTPANGYTGTVLLAVDFGADDGTLQNLCGGFANTNSAGFGVLTINGTTAATAQLQLDTNAADCSTSATGAKTASQQLRMMRLSTPAKGNSSNPVPATVAAAGLLLAGFFGRKWRKLRTLFAVLAVVAVGLAISACGSSSSTTTGGNGSGGTTSNPPKGTYTATITAVDQNNGSIAAQPVSFTFVIQ